MMSDFQRVQVKKSKRATANGFEPLSAKHSRFRVYPLGPARARCQTCLEPLELGDGVEPLDQSLGTAEDKKILFSQKIYNNMKKPNCI